MLWLFALLLVDDVVVNGHKPDNPVAFKLTPAFTLGEDPDGPVFSVGVTLTEGPDGAIYALDPGNARVVIFDKQGRLQGEFGKKGQGPGEFQQPKGIGVDARGRIAVFDTGVKRLSFLDTQGELLEDLSFAPGINAVFNPFFFKNGNALFASGQLGPEGQVILQLALYDRRIKPVKRLAAVEQPKRDWSRAGDPNFWAEFLKGQFERVAEGVPVGVMLDEDTIVSAMTNEYRGQIWNGAGESKGRFSKELKQKGFTEEGKRVFFENMWQNMRNNAFLARNMPRPVFERALREADLPDFQNPINRMFRFGDGFGVLVNYDHVAGKGWIEAFDKKGRCLGQTPYAGLMQSMYGAKTRLYAMGANQDDNIVIECYDIVGL